MDRLDHEDFDSKKKELSPTEQIEQLHETTFDELKILEEENKDAIRTITEEMKILRKENKDSYFKQQEIKEFLRLKKDQARKHLNRHKLSDSQKLDIYRLYEDLKRERSIRDKLYELFKQKENVLKELKKEELRIRKKLTILELSKYMSKDEANIVFNESQEWKDLIDLDNEEKKRHKEMIKFYIQQQIPDFKEEITDLDLQTFIENYNLSTMGSFDNSVDKGSLNLVKYYVSLLRDEEDLYFYGVSDAIEKNHPEITKYLLSLLKEDAHYKHIEDAVENKAFDVLDILLEKGEKTHKGRENIRSVIDAYVRESRDPEIREYFIDKGYEL